MLILKAAMPREIKTPLRYVTEDEPQIKRTSQSGSIQPVKIPNRGRPRTVGIISDLKNASNKPSPKKNSDSIIIPDDDSDVEIIEAPKPSKSSKKRKVDNDPDWESERKVKISRPSRINERAKREKAVVQPEPQLTQKETPTQPKNALPVSKNQGLQKSYTVDLHMECREEPLSLAQLTTMKKEQARYEMSQNLIKAARECRLIFLPGGGTKILDKPMPPPPTLPVTITPPLIPVAVSPLSHRMVNNINSQSKSPDVFIVGETPPKMLLPTMQISPTTSARAPVVPAASVAPDTIKYVHGTHGMGIRLPDGRQSVPVHTSASAQPHSETSHLKEILTDSTHSKVTPETITSAKARAQSEALANLRQQMQQQAQAKAESEPQKKKARKHAQLEGDESGNWVPLDEYYYGKMEGDPTYQEIKGEHRFKCWYCSKMLYNNVAAMMHIQGHIDSERQVNLDLSDLTQCKHCYKQFDTPFEMQTHIEKVHMNNTNVLLCRICEKDHDSRQALKEHMRKLHNACEMPYICQLCKFRSSMYSDVVDHFKKKHNSSDAMLCLYCLRVFHVRFVNQGWGQTSIFYNHLMKHQVKNACKKCQLCKLVFLNSADLKTHRKADHLANQKGVIGMNAKYTTPDQVMIKVTEKSDLSVQSGGVKSLNVPAVKKIMEHRLSFPSNVYKVKCIECKMLMGIPDHYKKFIQCSMCRFATSCSFAYSNHMMGFHSGQLTAAASHTPDESKLESKLYCSCGFVSSYGNRIANHLVSCSKSSCFKDPPPPSTADEFGQELQDPRKKPDASLLDILGLIKKDSLPPLIARTTPHRESPPPEPIDMPEVTISRKLSRRPSLLRNSKSLKNFSQEEKNRNLFQDVKFDKQGLPEKKEQNKDTYTDSVKLKSNLTETAEDENVGENKHEDEKCVHETTDKTSNVEHLDSTETQSCSNAKNGSSLKENLDKIIYEQPTQDGTILHHSVLPEDKKYENNVFLNENLEEIECKNKKPLLSDGAELDNKTSDKKMAEDEKVACEDIGRTENDQKSDFAKNEGKDIVDCQNSGEEDTVCEHPDNTKNKEFTQESCIGAEHGPLGTQITHTYAENIGESKDEMSLADEEERKDNNKDTDDPCLKQTENLGDANEEFEDKTGTPILRERDEDLLVVAGEEQPTDSANTDFETLISNNEFIDGAGDDISDALIEQNNIDTKITTDTQREVEEGSKERTKETPNESVKTNKGEIEDSEQFSGISSYSDDEGNLKTGERTQSKEELAKISHINESREDHDIPDVDNPENKDDVSIQSVDDSAESRVDFILPHSENACSDNEEVLVLEDDTSSDPFVMKDCEEISNTNAINVSQNVEKIGQVKNYNVDSDSLPDGGNLTITNENEGMEKIQEAVEVCSHNQTDPALTLESNLHQLKHDRLSYTDKSLELEQTESFQKQHQDETSVKAIDLEKVESSCNTSMFPEMPDTSEKADCVEISNVKGVISQQAEIFQSSFASEETNTSHSDERRDEERKGAEKSPADTDSNNKSQVSDVSSNRMPFASSSLHMQVRSESLDGITVQASSSFTTSRDKGRNQDSQRSRSRDRHKHRSGSKDKEVRRSKSRDKDRERRSRSRDKDRDRRSKSRDKDRNRRSRSRDKDRDKSWNPDKHRHHDHEPSLQRREHHRDREAYARNYDRDSYSSRSDDRNRYREEDWSRERQRNRENDRGREWNRNRERDSRERDQRRERSRERDRGRDYHRSREDSRYY